MGKPTSIGVDKDVTLDLHLYHAHMAYLRHASWLNSRVERLHQRAVDDVLALRGYYIWMSIAVLVS